MTDHERRCERWLRLYPKEYRRLRGDEILGTLLESSSDHEHLALGDIGYLAIHALRVRLRLVWRRPERPPLPQPARLVAWCLVAFGIMNLFDGTVLGGGGPKHPGPDVSEILGGVVFLSLAILLQIRRRYVYASVIAVLCVLVAIPTAIANQKAVVLLVASPLVVLAVVLGAGWRRYVATLSVQCPPSNPERVTSE